MGILGIIFICMWYYYLFTKALFIIRTSPDNLHSNLALAIIGTIPAMIITGINFDYFTGYKFILPLIETVILETILNIERHKIQERNAIFSK